MRGPSSAICASTFCCSCASRVCMSTASASSRVRMPSSRSASSSCCCALCCCDLTVSRRWRRRAISPRIFSRAALCGACDSARSARSATALRPKCPQCMLGPLLLRLFLRRPFAALRQAADLHLHDEALVVIGTDLVDHRVLRQRQSPPLRQLLQRGLVVVEEEVVGVDALDVVLERALDQRARRLDAAVEVDRRDDGLEQVRQQRVLLPPARLLFADAEVDDVPLPVLARLRGG